MSKLNYEMSNIGNIISMAFITEVKARGYCSAKYLINDKFIKYILIKCCIIPYNFRSL